MATATYNVQDLIAAKALAIISNQLPLVRHLNHDYEDKFAEVTDDHRIGQTIRIPKPARRNNTISSGWAINVQPVVEEVTSLTINTTAQDSTAFQDPDLALLTVDPEKNADSWAKKYIKPRVSKMANDIEANLYGTMLTGIYNLVGTAGTVPQSSQTWSDAVQKLDENLAPGDERCALLTSASVSGMREALKGTFVKEISEAALIKGFISELYGTDNYQTEIVSSHTNGTFGTDTVVTQNSGSPQTGSSIITTGWTSTHGVLAGDIITFAGVNAINYVTKAALSNLQQFVVTAAATNASGTTTLVISPAITTSGPDQTVSAAPSINAVVTFIGSSATAYRRNLMFHKDAFTVAFADLYLPKNIEMAARKSANGIKLRYTRQWDIVNSQLYDRIDAYFGIAPLYPQWATQITE